MKENTDFINTTLDKVAINTIVRLGHNNPDGEKFLVVTNPGPKSVGILCNLQTGEWLYGNTFCTFVRSDFRPSC